MKRLILLIAILAMLSSCETYRIYYVEIHAENGSTVTLAPEIVVDKPISVATDVGLEGM